MYLKKTSNLNGRIRLSIVDTYYDKAKKCSRQKTIESIGWLDELEKQYDAPYSSLSKKSRAAKSWKAARQAPIRFTFYDSDRLCIGDFVALTIARILENKLERKYSIGTILESLSKAECSLIQ